MNRAQYKSTDGTLFSSHYLNAGLFKLSKHNFPDGIVSIRFAMRSVAITKLLKVAGGEMVVYLTQTGSDSIELPKQKVIRDRVGVVFVNCLCVLNAVIGLLKGMHH